MGQIDTVYLKKYPTFYTTEKQLDRNIPYKPVDTLVNRDEIYHPLYKKTVVFQDLGNIGSANRDALFKWDRPMGFNFAFIPYEIYYKRPEQTEYFLTKKAYTDIGYAQGQRNFIFLNVKAAINITPRWNIGGDYSRITNEGFNVNQKTSGYFSNFFTSYFSKNQRYGLLVSYYRNRGINNENGGLVSDSLYETLNGTNKASSVRLPTAQSRYKNNGVQVKQYFYLGKKSWLPKDDDSIPIVERKGFISHTLTLNDERFFFDNPNGDTSYMFPTLGIDSTGAFYDSIAARTVTNTISYTLWSKSNETHSSYLSFAGSHQMIDAQQITYGNKYQNVWGEAKLEHLPKSDNTIGFLLSGAYCGIGYNQNDVKLTADFTYRNRRFDLSGGIANQLMEADYTMQNYRSFPFNWENRFSKISVLNWKASLSSRGFRHNFHIRFNQYLIANWVYFSTAVNPIQTTDILVVNTLEANKTFQLGIFRFEHQLNLQKANLNIVRLPELSGNIRYYLHAELFKKAMLVELGTSVFYNTAWMGYAWNPSARVFHLQDTYKIGNYPLIDVFANVKVMTLVFFFKLEHVNMDWKNQGFYYTPNYPLPIRAFRFGFNVRLYN